MAMDSRLEDVESLKNMLVARATGETPKDADYMRLRMAVLSDPVLKGLAPRFVRTCRSLGEFWQYIKKQHDKYDGRRTIIWDAFQPLFEHLEAAGRAPSDAVVSAAVEVFDAEHVQLTWAKALERRASDPDGAITLARTLLESLCKHILEECGVQYGDAPDLNKLYRLTAEQLRLSPGQHTETVFRQILGGCASVVEGLGSIRNRHSDAHGSGKNYNPPKARHAELAVNLAGSMASFLLATWDERQEAITKA